MSYEDLRNVVTGQSKSKLFRHCDEYGVVAFDCEWVPTKKRRPVAMLQLATHHGLCLLIRLCSLKRIPKELKVSVTFLHFM